MTQNTTKQFIADRTFALAQTTVLVTYMAVAASMMLLQNAGGGHYGLLGLCALLMMLQWLSGRSTFPGVFAMVPPIAALIFAAVEPYIHSPPDHVPRDFDTGAAIAFIHAGIYLVVGAHMGILKGRPSAQR